MLFSYESLIQKLSFVHHLNGKGLKATTSEVENSVYLGPFVIVNSKAKISGENIKIYGNVKVDSNIEISGENIKIFGYKEQLCFCKNFYEKNIDVYGSGKWDC